MCEIFDYLAEETGATQRRFSMSSCLSLIGQQELMSQAQDAEERLRNGESWQGLQRPGSMGIAALSTQRVGQDFQHCSSH